MAKDKASPKDRNVTHEGISQKELLELVLQYCRDSMATKEDVQKAARETENKLSEELKPFHSMAGEFKSFRKIFYGLTIALIVVLLAVCMRIFFASATVPTPQVGSLF